MLLLPVYLPKELQSVYFYAPFEEPPPPLPGETRTPEQIEAEMRKMEQKLESLALITVVLPDNVLWFEPPVAALWEEKEFVPHAIRKSLLLAQSKAMEADDEDEEEAMTDKEEDEEGEGDKEKVEKPEMLPDLREYSPIVDSEPREKFSKSGRWTSKYIHDLKYNEEKQLITFRSSKLGILGLAAQRYLNLPFQNWDCRPDETGSGILFTITAAIVAIDFHISKDGFKILIVRGAPSDVLKKYYNKTYTLNLMIQYLRDAGVDIFPDHDAFCYIEGHCEKQMPMEKHLAYTMGLFAATHNFASSRWNSTLGRRHVVILLREVLGKKHYPPFTTLYVTPLNATVVDCVETSPVFSSEPDEKYKGFYPDFFQLSREIVTPTARKKVSDTDFELQDNLAHFLIATRVLSLS